MGGWASPGGGSRTGPGSPPAGWPCGHLPLRGLEVGGARAASLGRPPLGSVHVSTVPANQTRSPRRASPEDTDMRTGVHISCHADAARVRFGEGGQPARRPPHAPSLRTCRHCCHLGVFSWGGENSLIHSYLSKGILDTSWQIKTVFLRISKNEMCLFSMSNQCNGGEPPRHQRKNQTENVPEHSGTFFKSASCWTTKEHL